MKLIILLLLSSLAVAQNLTVMSYNIRVDFGGDGENNWEFRRDFLAGQIAFNAPDFIGTQEGKHHQLKYIDSTLAVYDYIGISRDESKDEGEFSAIFYNSDKFRVLKESTFWLSETPDKRSKGWDAALERNCTYGLFEEKQSKKRFYVFNTHFDHVGEIARQKSAKLILRKISEINHENLPVIVTGDFNAVPTSAAYLEMTKVLKDSRSVSKALPFGPSGTFNGFKFNEPVNLLIDYIFVSDGLIVNKHATLSDSRDCRYPSDHLPVIAEISLK